MRRGFFYTRLALTGMRGNGRLYLPYLLTAAGMAAVFYIMAALTYMPLEGMKGGRTVVQVLGLGRVVVGIFALLFLFYTNAFLIRRRNREFGLYNVLGLDKGDIGRVLLRETLLSYGFAMAAGLGLGVLLCALAELLLGRVLGLENGGGFSLSAVGAEETLAVFALIFALLLAVSLGRVRLRRPLELLKSESVGEKPPRANWVLALLGLLLLGAAYYLALSVKEPVTAVLLFFGAVLLVIAGTYLLFIAGSVTLCRALQRNKRYYYRARHFVSVSSMLYRMKRNGAGLASICILSTMVLVMLSSTTCLYRGSQDALRAVYPYDIVVTGWYERAEDCTAEKREQVEALVAGEAGGAALTSYRHIDVSGMLGADGSLALSPSGGLPAYDELRSLHILPLEDYERLSGKTWTLSPGEALLWSSGGAYPYETLRIEGCPALRIAAQPETLPIRVSASDAIVTNYYLAVPDWAELAGAVERALRDGEGQTSLSSVTCAFDLWEGADPSALQARLYDAAFAWSEKAEGVFWAYSVQSYYDDWEYTMGLYSGLFFLGILLSVVFMLATVLIIYYKQLSEGYEDAGRFAIMHKVGMSDREIRRSVNSQVLTVFFAPLLTAGVHLAFAFPMVWLMIRFLGVNDLGLLIGTNAGCFLAFALLYVLVYRLTARGYYRIVSGAGA